MERVLRSAAFVCVPNPMSGVNRTSEPNRRSVLPRDKCEASPKSQNGFANLDKAEGVTVNKIQVLIVAVALSAAALVAAIFGDTSSAAPQRASKGVLVSIHKTA